MSASPRLAFLTLSHCALGDAAAAALAPALASAPALSSADLAHNALAWRGAAALAAALGGAAAAPGGSRLRSLVLDGCPLGQAGVLPLLRLLQASGPSADGEALRLSLCGASLAAVPGEPLQLDPEHPNGHWALDLSKPDHRAVRRPRATREGNSPAKGRLAGSCASPRGGARAVLCA